MVNQSTPSSPNRNYAKPGTWDENTFRFNLERIADGIDDIDTDVQSIVNSTAADIQDVVDDLTAAEGNITALDGRLDSVETDITALKSKQAVEKTINFTTQNNGEYIIGTGVTEITIHTPSVIGETFTIEPKLGTVDFETDGILITGTSTINGATLDVGYINENVRYTFRAHSLTDWRVTGEGFDL
jgi:hypothetical protein